MIGAGVLMLALLSLVRGLSGYNCGDKGLITFFLLLDITMCNLDNVELTKSETYIQLMQTSKYNHKSTLYNAISKSTALYTTAI